VQQGGVRVVRWKCEWVGRWGQCGVVWKASVHVCAVAAAAGSERWCRQRLPEPAVKECAGSGSGRVRQGKCRQVKRW